MTTPGSPEIDNSVRVIVAPAPASRNRLTVAFRPILALPHVLLVGGINVGSSGVLGAVATVCAVVSWFAIVFTGKHPHGLWDLELLYLRWKTRAIGYNALLRDEYPPFADTDYPVQAEVAYPGARSRVSVGLRLVLVIPHIVVLAALVIAWGLVTVIAWFAIVIAGRFPRGLYGFSAGVMAWSIRVEAYLLLLRDEYPPFKLG